MTITIDNVCEDNLKEIYSYIPYVYRKLHSKCNYQEYIKSLYKNDDNVFNIIKNRKIVKTTNIYNNISHIRMIIRNDLNFILSNILTYNFINWLNIKNYIYNKLKFRNFTEFIMYYANENNADKCKNIMIDYFDIYGLSKNRHKKINYKNIIRING